MILHWLLLLSFLGQRHHVQGDDTFVCPSESGVFPHPDTNTRFYRCVDSKPVLHICTTGIFVPSKGFCLETRDAASTATLESKSVERDAESTSLKTSSSSPSPSTTKLPTDSTTTTTSKSTATVGTSLLEKITAAAKLTSNKVTSGPSSSTTASETTDTHSSGKSTTTGVNSGVAAASDADQEASGTDKPTTTTTASSSSNSSSTTTTTTASTTTTATTTTQAGASPSTDKNQPEKKPKAETYHAVMDMDYDYWSDEGNNNNHNHNHDHDSGAYEEFFHCPTESGFFRHPTDCSRFYWCTDNRPTSMFCAPGTAFDEETHVCSWIVGSDGCGGRLAAPTFKDSSSNNDYMDPFDDAWTSSRHHRHRRSAESLGEGTRSGRHPRQVGDEGRIDNGGREGNRGGRRKGQSFGVDSDRDVNFGASAVTFQCPGDGFYADPRDCSVFYHCSNGKPYRHQCQPGTAFNKDKLVCSWPLEEDGCGGMLSVPYKGVIDGQLPSVDDPNSIFRCPDEMEGYYPDPDDCTVFYHCAQGGGRYRHKCGNGTAFNKETGVCSWPLSADTGCGAVLYKAGLIDRSQRYKVTKDSAADGGDRRQHSEGQTSKAGVTKREVEDRDTSSRRHGDVDKAEGSEHRIEAEEHAQQKREESSGRVLADEPLPKTEDEPVKGDSGGEGRAQDSRESPRAETEPETSTASSSPSKVKQDESGKSRVTSTSGNKTGHEKKAEHSPDQSKSSSDDAKSAAISDQSKSTLSSATKDSRTTVSKSKTTSSPTTTTAKPSALKAKSDGLESLPGVIDSKQRTNAWPWESVERKQKAKRATYTTTKPTAGSSSNSQKNPATTQAPSVTQSLAKKESPSPKGTSSATPTTTTTGKGTTVKASSSASTTRKVTTTTAAAATTTTTTTTTTTAAAASTAIPSTTAEPSTVDTVKAEAYRVAGATTDFRCPSPSGHFRDPMNCAVYYHCADGVAFRKDCPNGKLYDINQHKCLLIPEVKDCRRVDEKELEWEEKWLSKYPEMDSFPDKSAIPDSVQCETPFGYFKNERDCSSYIECIDGVPYHRQCMTGTVFDVSRKKCTWSSLVPDCRMAARTHSDESSTPTEADKFVCPSLDGYYRDPFSCSTYFHCIDGTAMPRVCDPNFFFDPRASKCRWNKLVTDCDAMGYPVVMDKLPLSSFVCPLPNGHYRDPKDCSVFYHCLRDIPYRGACRRHHAFDVDTLTCVPRAEVPGCEYNQVAEGADGPPSEKTEQNDSVPSVDEDASPSPVSEEGWGDSTEEEVDRSSEDTSFRCPEAHGLFRDPHDCRIFYHCFSGRHFRHECQFGTVFSIERNLCTWPSLVSDCRRVTESQEISTLDPYTSHETKEWQAQSVPKSFKLDHQHDAPLPTSSEKVEAPRDVTEERHDDVEDAPGDGDAMGGVADSSSPADSERFDYDLRDVNVAPDYSPSSFDSGVNAFVVESPYPPGSVVDRPGDNDNDFVCPQIVFDQYFRDPLDCTRFHRCVKGLRFTFDCPRGTFFDPIYNICDFQERVPDCDHEGRRLGSAREPLGSSGQIPMPVYTGDGGEYMSEPSPDLTSSDMCPSSDGLFPHPSSCRKFVYCSHGTPVVLTCPADLLYNIDTMTCDYDENIVCVRYDK